MLKNDNVVSIQKNLLAGNYFQVLNDLRSIGRPIKKAWHLQRFQEKNETSENKFTVNVAFKKFLVEALRNVKIITDQQLYTLKNTLLRLTLFLMLWKDNPKFQIESLNASKAKKLRQKLKYKSQLDKDDRHAINIGLQTVIFIVSQQINNAIKQNTTDSENAFKEAISKDKLIHFLFLQQENLKKELPKNLSLNENSLSKSNLKETEKIGKIISAFQTPNKKKKLIKYTGIGMAFIAALACGASTGAAIILLFPSLSITAIILGGLIALFGFTANFSFLSKNFPDFILSLTKKGGISEYIDNDGHRKQFSTTYKYLFTPLAIFASLTVGAGATALTAITIFGLITKFLPILTFIWPPLPFIIVGILAVSVGITLTVATLTASLELLKKLAGLNMGFLNLCQFACKHCVEWFKHLKNAKTHEKVGLVIMLLLLPIGLAGLAYYRYTAGIDLSIFIGLAGAAIMGLVAYIAQMAFVFLSINKLKNAIVRPFFSNTIQQQASTNPSSSINLLNQTKSFFSSAWYSLGLTINAIGNSVLVYNGSVLSIAGAVSCGVNSFSGNMLTTDIYQVQRNQANQFINQEYEEFIAKTNNQTESLEHSILVSENNPQQPTLSQSTINTLFFHQPKNSESEEVSNEKNNMRGFSSKK